MQPEGLTLSGRTQSLDGPPNLTQLVGEVAGLAERLRASVVARLDERRVILLGRLPELRRR